MSESKLETIEVNTITTEGDERYYEGTLRDGTPVRFSEESLFNDFSRYNIFGNIVKLNKFEKRILDRFIDELQIHTIVKEDTIRTNFFSSAEIYFLMEKEMGENSIKTLNNHLSSLSKKLNYPNVRFKNARRKGYFLEIKRFV